MVDPKKNRLLTWLCRIVVIVIFILLLRNIGLHIQMYVNMFQVNDQQAEKDNETHISYKNITDNTQILVERITKKVYATTKGDKRTVEDSDSIGKWHSYKYVVKPGDTLWDIATAYYGYGRSYSWIYDCNLDTLAPDPDFILPGMVLSIRVYEYPSEDFESISW